MVPVSATAGLRAGGGVSGEGLACGGPAPQLTAAGTSAAGSMSSPLTGGQRRAHSQQGGSPSHSTLQVAHLRYRASMTAAMLARFAWLVVDG